MDQTDRLFATNIKGVLLCELKNTLLGAFRVLMNMI
jgi:hypothetical protein